jgi:hypothetical protein
MSLDKPITTDHKINKQTFAATEKKHYFKCVHVFKKWLSAEECAKTDFSKTEESTAHFVVHTVYHRFVLRLYQLKQRTVDI